MYYIEGVRLSLSKHRKIQPVTEEEYQKCNEWNREILEEFLQQSHLSPDSIKQYRSAGRIFLRFVYDKFQNKPVYELKARNGMLYQNWLDGLGLSSSAVRFRRSLVSSLSNYIELYYGEDYPLFRNIFPKGVAQVPQNKVREKIPLTMDEWNHLIFTLKERKETQILAYVLFSYYSSARRSEVSLLMKEIANYEQVKDTVTGEKLGYYETHLVRTKGKSKAGNMRKLVFNDITKRAIEDWIAERGQDDEPSLFVRKMKSGKVEPLSRGTFNEWCSGLLSDIVGREIYPHLFRSTRATHLVIYEGKDISIAQNLLGHLDSSTTSIYIVNPNANNMSGAFE